MPTPEEQRQMSNAVMSGILKAIGIILIILLGITGAILFFVYRVAPTLGK